MLTRFGLGALVFALVKWRDLRDLSTKELRGGFFAGLFLFLGFALQTFGLEDTTPARNAFFTATSILLVPFFTWLIFKERPPLRIFLAALLCFPGVLILSLDGATLRLSLSRGDILTLLGRWRLRSTPSSLAYLLSKRKRVTSPFCSFVSPPSCRLDCIGGRVLA